MRVMIRRDSATNTPVELGEGPEAEEKLRRLVATHGAHVTNEDGSPVVLEVVPEAPAPKKKHKRDGDDQ